MENELIIARDDQVAPRPEARDELLIALAKKANEAHLRLVMSAKAGMLAAVEAGLALAEAKRVCPLGRWRAWLAENFEGSYRTAHRYVEFAKQFKLAKGSHVTSVSHLPPQETDAILAKLLAVSRGKKDAKAAAKLDHQAASTAADGTPQLSAPQPAVSQPAASQSPATRLPQYRSYAPSRLFPPSDGEAPPSAYERPATNPLLRAEQLLDESMRRVRDARDSAYVERRLRELEPIHGKLARHNQERKRRLLAAGYVLR